ncbi:type II CRISPR-associated endonuclease Cas1 [Alloprevotella tannerae]|jgi:CRISPR-associated endonuclease cas1, NMENI subtype|uniref:type II CRISPR-associated endonuclease Cas1 n=1 Tax=Alloprevotella tannerae TaxID=76122 RepID=UPI0028ED2152|nr:type II CRISPR-associated endonuclease Cas1 [Alloprevotella tannerae]
MLKRSLVFMHPATLSLRNGQMVIIRKEIPDDNLIVPIEDICLVMINHAMVSLTIPLLNALTEQNVAVIFCNEKGMPASMLYNLQGNTTQGETLRNQLEAGEVLKKTLWKQIIEAKIKNQAALLNKMGKKGSILKPLYTNVKSGDSDNREGIAARLYWTALFGRDFIRDRNIPGINSLLNYGYSILRAAVTRALVSSGLFPALGIFHHHRSNAFPLSDDLMEPFRPFVDEIVFELTTQGETELNTATKSRLIRVLYVDTYFSKVTRPLSVGLSMTMASLAKCYAKEQKKLVVPLLK